MKKTVLTILAMIPLMMWAAGGYIIPKSGSALNADINQVTTEGVSFYPIDILGKVHKLTQWPASRVARIVIDSTDIDIRNQNGQLYNYAKGILEEPGTILFEDSMAADSTRYVPGTQVVYKEITEAEQKRMSDPNYTIGLAMKKSGAVCIGLGVPSLLAGTILCICGNKGPSDDELNKVKTYKDLENLSKKYTRMNTSGAILAGAGGALTIAGIPLYVHGKKLMDLNVQMSENGAGVSVKF